MKSPTRIAKDNTTFVLMSFEGPDRYSLAGGLGVRIRHLSEALASSGYETHLLFIGDPNRQGCETRLDGKLTLHRWCQWISKYYPDGVYQGEEEKLWDFKESAPSFLAREIVGPAVRQGRFVVIMGEEWQTTEAMCKLGDILRSEGVRDRVVMLWNANNTFSFDRIDWSHLTQHATITTVSRYMKHIMWQMKLNPLVIPNGIPSRLLKLVDRKKATYLRKAFSDRLVLSKIARWDPDKRWNMAIEAVATLKSKGSPVLLMARGGIEAHEVEVMSNARGAGLIVKDVQSEGDTVEEHIEAIRQAGNADILNLKFYLDEEMSRLIYYGADGVLANSGHEPFGLVGLETMAAGGVAFTGCTGEDYAIPLENAIVLETDDPAEIVEYVSYLEDHEEEQENIRKAGRRTAQHYTWEEVVSNLLSKLEYLARNQKALSNPGAGTRRNGYCSPNAFSEEVDQACTAEAAIV
ncbi:MAG: glycosyltransferase [Dehalococcoidales bacterium]|nr:glycosyltransferase [Dehalococcoidales bacterium]